MSTPYAEALTAAEFLRDTLAPSCRRIAIAGSIRRRCECVNDIEILYVPELVPVTAVQPELFGSKGDGKGAFLNLADDCLARLLRTRILVKRLNVDGEETWGPLNKLATLNVGIDADFFATTEERWSNSLVFRTGSRGLNELIAKRARAKGWRWEVYGVGFKRESGLGWERKAMASEAEVFAFVGLDYLEPEARSL